MLFKILRNDILKIFIKVEMMEAIALTNKKAFFLQAYDTLYN